MNCLSLKHVGPGLWFQLILLGMEQFEQSKPFEEFMFANQRSKRMLPGCSHNLRCKQTAQQWRQNPWWRLRMILVSLTDYYINCKHVHCCILELLEISPCHPPGFKLRCNHQHRNPLSPVTLLQVFLITGWSSHDPSSPASWGLAMMSQVWIPSHGPGLHLGPVLT